MKALPALLAECQTQRDIIWKRLIHDGLSPIPEPGTLTWTQRRLNHRWYADIVNRLHRQIIAEAPRDATFPVLVAAVDELVAAHKLLMDDAWGASEQRRQYAAEPFERHCTACFAVERLLPIAEPAGDISGDTQKKKKKSLRRVHVEYVDCDRIYQEAKKKGFPLTQPQVVADYLDANECEMTSEGLLRGWKAYRKARREGTL